MKTWTTAGFLKAACKTSGLIDLSLTALDTFGYCQRPVFSKFMQEEINKRKTQLFHNNKLLSDA